MQLKHNPKRDIKIEQKGINPNQTVICPFCLVEAVIDKFCISEGKKGINKSKGKCPNCGTNMMLETLAKVSKMTPEQYAAWVQSYRGFFFKIKQIVGVGFEGWKKQLKEKGWSKRFWDEYKKLKAENPQDTTKYSSDFDPSNYFETPQKFCLKPNSHTGPPPVPYESPVDTDEDAAITERKEQEEENEF